VKRTTTFWVAIAAVIFAAGLMAGALSPRLMELRVDKSVDAAAGAPQAHFSAKLDRRDGVFLRKELVIGRTGHVFRAAMVWGSKE